MSLMSSALAGRFFPLVPPGKPILITGLAYFLFFNPLVFHNQEGFLTDSCLSLQSTICFSIYLVRIYSVSIIPWV